jgi:hypothetical protein
MGAVRMIPQHIMDSHDNQMVGNDTEQSHEEFDDDTELVDFRNIQANPMSSNHHSGLP